MPEESKKTTNSTMLEADKEGIRNYARALSDEEKVIILQEIEPRFIFLTKAKFLFSIFIINTSNGIVIISVIAIVKIMLFECLNIRNVFPIKAEITPSHPKP